MFTTNNNNNNLMILSLLFSSLIFWVCCPTTNAQHILGNSYIEKQLLCALDQAPCDILGRQIKGALPEIIGNNCARCDERQVANAKRIARFVQTKYPDVWNTLVEKYS